MQIDLLRWWLFFKEFKPSSFQPPRFPSTLI